MGVAAKGRFERASFLRHLAICVAAVVAFVLRGHVHAGDAALWIIGLTGAANLAVTLVGDVPRWAGVSRVLSPCSGLAGWSVLVHLTGGSDSPFVAGLWIEIVLSAWIGSPAGTVLVTCGAAAALWTQEVLLGHEGGSARALALQTGFLAAMGGVTFLLTRQWARAQRASQRRQEELAVRLRALEGEMEAWRATGVPGEHVARLAHAMKNAIHGLRGFAALTEGPWACTETEARAREGLRAAIDRLEEIARTALGGGPLARPVASLEGAQTRRIIEQALAEVALSYPGVAWRAAIHDALPTVHADGAALREALLNLTHNAAQAMHGTGDVDVATVVEGDRFEIRVRDHGRGFPEDDQRRTLAPGFTTKGEGSGFGLFLTRRSVEVFGGRITIAPAAGGGAVVSVGLVRGPGGGP